MTTASEISPRTTIELPLSRLSPLIVLAIYLVVPAVILFVMIDVVATDLEFSRRISFDTHLFMLFGLLLQSPHAFASMVTFADREYAVAYKFTLAKCGLVGMGALALIWLAGEGIFMACLMTYNFYHQNSQQAGIAAMVARNKSRLHNVWRWMAIIIEMAGFWAILIRNSPNVQILPPAAERPLILLSALFLAGFGVIAVLVARQSKTSMGRLLIGAHTGMLYVYVGLFAVNLPLLMILSPIVVHDFTAFAFYINHNTNRNRETRRNVASRLRNIIPVPEYFFTPLVAILITAAVYSSASASFIGMMAALVNVMHIYLEGVMWQAGSPHRKYTLV